MASSNQGSPGSGAQSRSTGRSFVSVDPERQREVPAGTDRTGVGRHPAPEVHPRDAGGIPGRGARPAGAARNAVSRQDDDEGGSGRLRR